MPGKLMMYWSRKYEQDNEERTEISSNGLC